MTKILNNFDYGAGYKNILGINDFIIQYFDIKEENILENKKELLESNIMAFANDGRFTMVLYLDGPNCSTINISRLAMRIPTNPDNALGFYVDTTCSKTLIETKRSLPNDNHLNDCISSVLMLYPELRGYDWHYLSSDF